MRVITIMLLACFLSGCLVRTYTIQKERQDLEVEGNRGYLMGAPEEPPKEKKQTRPITVFEFELGGHQPQEGVDESAQEVTDRTTIEEELYET